MFTIISLIHILEIKTAQRHEDENTFDKKDIKTALLVKKSKKDGKRTHLLQLLLSSFISVFRAFPCFFIQTDIYMQRRKFRE